MRGKERSNHKLHVFVSIILQQQMQNQWPSISLWHLLACIWKRWWWGIRQEMFEWCSTKRAHQFRKYLLYE